jgi:Tol biopolymer transport system component
VPVYHSPDVNSPIAANIAWGEKYPVLDRQGEWYFERSGSSGQFYQIQLNELNIGWVLDMRGGLEGNCAPYQTQVKKPPIFTGQLSAANDCSFEPSAVISDTLPSAMPIRVIFIAENGIHLWDEESNTTELLFGAEDITSLAFSDDHQLIAFTRRNAERQASVWVMDGQGQAARELLSPEELLALNLSEDKDLAVDPYNLRWVPGSHRLAFSTRTTTAEDAPPDVFQELRVLNADNGSLTQLLDHSEGGTYTFSPDGAFFVLVSDTTVSLYWTNGELIASNIVTYPALGITDFYHHPPIYWDANSRFFTFAMINAADNMDAIYNPDVTSTVWRVMVDGSTERLPTIHGLSLDHAFSPDLERIAFMRVSPKGPPLREMHIADVYYAWDIVYREGDSLTFGDWNPVEETLHFTFFDGWGEPSTGRLCYDPMPLPSVSGPGFTYRVSWVDATRYLYVTHPEQALLLGSLRGSQKLVSQMGQEQVTGEIGPLKVYDFYASPSATSEIPLTDDPQPVQALPGMIYEDEAGIWLVESTGSHKLLTSQGGLKISPDGARGLQIVDGDVWIHTLSTGERINLTGGTGRSHIYATWWPARPDTLVLSSNGPEDEGHNHGRLTLVNIDGSNYHIVQSEGPIAGAAPAPSPDGRTIAYDMALTGKIYDLEAGIEPFNPDAYGLPEGVQVVRMGSPSWSPDGGRLAWMMAVVGGGYGQGEAWDIVLSVFDLSSRQVKLIHPYQPVGRGGWLPPATWSTDGRWLTFSVETGDEVEGGLWVASADGSIEQRLSPLGNSPVIWSPPGNESWADGRALILSVPYWKTEGEIWLVKSGSWHPAPLELPVITVRDWRQLPLPANLEPLG